MEPSPIQHENEQDRRLLRWVQDTASRTFERGELDACPTSPKNFRTLQQMLLLGIKYAREHPSLDSTPAKVFYAHGNEYDWDEAAVFGIAKGIDAWWINNDIGDISADYNGADEFSRRCLRAGIALDRWANKYVDWDEFTEVWPYYAEDVIGPAMMDLVTLGQTPSFFGTIPAALKHKHLLALAAHMKLPIKVWTPGAWINLERSRGVPSSPGFGTIQVRSVFTDKNETDAQWWTQYHVQNCTEYKDIKYAVYVQNKEGLWDFMVEYDTYEECRQTIRFLAGSDPWDLPVDPVVQYPGQERVIDKTPMPDSSCS